MTKHAIVDESYKIKQGKFISYEGGAQYKLSIKNDLFKLQLYLFEKL